jgi:hypothetical protein
MRFTKYNLNFTLYLVENFDSQTASYVGSVIGIISLQFAKDFMIQTQRLLKVETTWCVL